MTNDISNIAELTSFARRARRPGNLAILEPSKNYNWEDRVCIINETGAWEVFYCERGQKLALRTFNDERSAVRYFLELAGKARIL